MNALADGKQITRAPHGHILTNANVWSPDSRWIVHDCRRVGSVFDATRIERVNVETGESQVLYESSNGACCGVVTHSPTDDRVVFIHGPENPTQVTENPWDVQSAFTWSPDGRLLSYVMDNSVFVTAVDAGQSHRLTPRAQDAAAPTAYACVVSPDGQKVAYTRNVSEGGDHFDQIFVVDIPQKLRSR
jgi:Tol biopolymer transport system component